MSLVYQNELLFDNYMLEERDDGYWFERESRSEVFPLWYFYGEKFIEQEIDKLLFNVNISNQNLIKLNASRKVLESFKIDLSGIEAADITWSVVPSDPFEPKKRLIMIAVLFIVFLISIFLFYVLEIFRGSKYV